MKYAGTIFGVSVVLRIEEKFSAMSFMNGKQMTALEPPMVHQKLPPGSHMREQMNRRNLWFYKNLRAFAPILNLVRLEAIRRLTGYGSPCAVGYTTTMFRRMVLDELLCLFGDLQLKIVHEDWSSVSLADIEDDIRCIVVLDQKWTPELAAWELEMFEEPSAAAGPANRARPAMVHLAHVESLGRSWQTTNFVIVQEPATPTARAALSSFTQMRFSAEGQLRLGELRNTVQAPIPAERYSNMRTVFLPMEDHLSVRTPQSPVRGLQIYELASAMVCLRDSTGSDGATSIAGADAIAKAAALLTQCGASDDSPDLAESVTNFARALGRLPWDPCGETYISIVRELNRDLVGCDEGLRSVVRSLTGERWTYPTVRRRVLELEQVGWLTKAGGGSPIRWVKTGELDHGMDHHNYFAAVHPIDPDETCNFHGLSAADENTQTIGNEGVK